MSTDDSTGRVRRRWPMSALNTVLVGVCLAGAVVAFVLGTPLAGVALLVGGVFGGGGAILARRAGSGDLERVNALEYADERDRAAGIRGLAVVGVVALVGSAVQLVVFAIVRVGAVSRGVGIVMFLVLVLSWFVANWWFVRRG